MFKVVRVFGVIFILVFLLSCTSDWSTKKKEEFKKECSKVMTFSNTVILKDFDPLEIKDLKIVEKTISKEAKPVVFTVKKETSPSQVYYTLRLSEDFNVKSQYEIYIGSDKTPYILSDMRMSMEPRRTMTSYNYACEMRHYSIDGKEKYMGNIYIHKRKK